MLVCLPTKILILILIVNSLCQLIFLHFRKFRRVFFHFLSISSFIDKRLPYSYTFMCLFLKPRKFICIIEDSRQKQDLSKLKRDGPHIIRRWHKPQNCPFIPAWTVSPHLKKVLLLVRCQAKGMQRAGHALPCRFDKRFLSRPAIKKGALLLRIRKPRAARMKIPRKLRPFRKRQACRFHQLGDAPLRRFSFWQKEGRGFLPRPLPVLMTAPRHSPPLPVVLQQSQRPDAAVAPGCCSGKNALPLSCLA